MVPIYYPDNSRVEAIAGKRKNMDQPLHIGCGRFPGSLTFQREHHTTCLGKYIEGHDSFIDCFQDLV
jgi:hypothetical protein